MRHKISLLYNWFIYTFLYFLPDVPILMRFRGWLYGLDMKHCGKNFQVAHSTILNGTDRMAVGDNVYFANFCNVLTNGIISIGSNTLFGPHVVISAGNHQFDGQSFINKIPGGKDVTIGENVWVASHVTILAGSKVPNQSLVAAGAVVTPGTEQTERKIYGGIPAKAIGDVHNRQEDKRI